MKIHTYPDPILTTPAEPIENINDEIRGQIDKMIDTMYSASGIGLAANQIGSLKRVVVFDRTPQEEGRNPCELINPEIVKREGSILWNESCLSVIDYSAEVRRNLWVKIQGFDRHGNPMDIEAEDLAAVCLQHEIDHLDGILFIHHISSLKRALYKKKLKKKQTSE